MQRLDQNCVSVADRLGSDRTILKNTRTYHVNVVHERGGSHHGQSFLGCYVHHELIFGVSLAVAIGGCHHKDFPISNIMEMQARRYPVEDEFLVRLLNYEPVACLSVIGNRVFVCGVGHGDEI